MSIRIGKVMGIPIRIDISWLVALALIVYSLAMGYFHQMFRQFSTTTDWIAGFLAALFLFASVLLHELMHSYVAVKNGLPVGGITLFIFGGVSQLQEEPRTPETELKMAIAGPLTSLAIGAVLLLFLHYASIPRGSLAAAIIGSLGSINILLGIFNLIPGFPLDGGRVLRAILWGSLNDLDRATKIAVSIGQTFGYIFIIGGFWVMLMGAGLSGLWLVLIGWFLNNAAQQSGRQTMLKKALSGVDVHRVMTTDCPHVEPDTTIDQFVHDYLLKYDYSAFPVSEDDNLIGIITVNEVRSIPREDWHNVTVRQVVKPPDQESTIDENADAFDALLHMAQGKSDRLLVLHDGKLRGMVTQDSIINIVRTKLQLGI